MLTATWWLALKDSAGSLEVVSVQQTASGLGPRRLRRSPIVKIDVARSAAKRVFESRIIVDGVLAKIASLNRLLDRTNHFGVVGLGALGKARHHAARQGQGRLGL